MVRAIPELSLADYTRGDSGARDAFCRNLVGGFRRYGFIILRDHPVPHALVDRAYELGAECFSQAEEVKRRYMGGVRGYAPLGTEHAKNRAAPDLKEF
ncbi:MAG: hypothetical protein JWN43_2313, partial [Gammaproteobacteria bacterium]|nr:hypothetical protein [Gammaproteobacteria bacterium]